jgi:hypothetical protein
MAVSLTVALELLTKIEPTLLMDGEQGYSFDWEGARAALEYLSNAPADASKRGEVLLLVRQDRKVSRFVAGGAYYDAPDTSHVEGAIAKRDAIDVPMLMLFRQNGMEEQGWRGTPFYWPVIWAPKNTRTAVYSHLTS